MEPVSAILTDHGEVDVGKHQTLVLIFFPFVRKLALCFRALLVKTAKVHFLSLSFYERHTLMLVFTSGKKSEEDFRFYDERSKKQT